MPPVLCNMERAHVHKLHVVGKINIEKSKARAWSSRRRSTPETAANWNKKRRGGGLYKRILRRAIEEEKLDIYCLMERESTQVTRVAHTFPFFSCLALPHCADELSFSSSSSSPHLEERKLTIHYSYFMFRCTVRKKYLAMAEGVGETWDGSITWLDETICRRQLDKTISHQKRERRYIFCFLKRW